MSVLVNSTSALLPLHLLLDKDINGQKADPEVHLETHQRRHSGTPRHYQTPSVESPQPNSPPYRLNRRCHVSWYENESNAPSDGYAHAGNASSHTTSSLTVPLSAPAGNLCTWVSSKHACSTLIHGCIHGIPTGCVMIYPEASHPYDPSHSVPMQPPPIRPQQQQLDQNGTPIIRSSSVSAEGATTSQPIQTISTVANGPTTASAPDETIEPVDIAPESVQARITQVHADPRFDSRTY